MLWKLTEQHFKNEPVTTASNLSGGHALKLLQDAELRLRTQNLNASFKSGPRMFRMVQIDGSDVITYVIEPMEGQQ